MGGKVKLVWSEVWAWSVMVRMMGRMKKGEKIRERRENEQERERKVGRRGGGGRRELRDTFSQHVLYRRALRDKGGRGKTPPSREERGLP